jgi:hypothetical protein
MVAWLDIFLSIALPFVALGFFAVMGQWFLARAQNKAKSIELPLATQKDSQAHPAAGFELPGSPGWESAFEREVVRLHHKERGW